MSNGIYICAYIYFGKTYNLLISDFGMDRVISHPVLPTTLDDKSPIQGSVVRMMTESMYILSWS